MKELIIVGGGTAGYLTALILKTRFADQLNITIIKSNKTRKNGSKMGKNNGMGKDTMNKSRRR